MLSGVLIGAAQAPAKAEVSYPLLLTTVAIGIGLLTWAWKSWNAESNQEENRYDDFKDARAGFNSGRVDPALAAVIEKVLRIRDGDDEPIIDVLARSDVSDAVDALATVVADRNVISASAKRLTQVSTILAVILVLVVVTGAAFMLNPIAGHDLISGGLRTIALVLLSGAVAMLFACGVVVRQLNLQLSRAIKTGKDAASGS